MSLIVISLCKEFFPYAEKVNVFGEEYVYFFSREDDRISALEFCNSIKAKKCIFISNKLPLMPNGNIIKEITYDKIMEYVNILPKDVIDFAKKNGIELSLYDVNTLRTTKIRNFIEHS